MPINDCVIHQTVRIPQPSLVNLYGCEIGEGTKVAAFVEIQRGVKIGKNCKIESFAFIPTGVTIEDNVFIGPHVCFTNDRRPHATHEDGTILGPEDWTITPTVVKQGAAIGANTTVVCGVVIGAHSLVGAGSTVTKDVAHNSTVYGNPARRQS